MPAVTDRAAGIEHERVGRALGAELIGHDIAGILQDRKRDLVLVGIVGDVGQRILGVGVDADEGHALVFVAGRQLGQTRARPVLRPGIRSPKKMTTTAFLPAHSSSRCIAPR